MLLEIQALVERLTEWFLRNGRQPLDIAGHVAEFGPSIAELKACLADVLGPRDRDQLAAAAKRFADTGVPPDLAHAIASLDVLASACDVVRLAASSGQPVGTVAAVYFGVGARFALDWLREKAGELTANTHWQKLAVDALIDDFFLHQSVLAQDVLARAAENPGEDEGAGEGTGRKRRKQAGNGPDGAIAAWAAGRRDGVDRTDRLLADIRGTDQVDLAMLAVANGQMRSLLAR
jgi:glutamate dehydrogenase